MSHSGTQSGTVAFNASQLQPKFKDCQLSGDKGRNDLRQWINLISSIVSNIEHGRPIELFLDHYLDRATFETRIAPSFLTDGALALPVDDDGGISIGSQDTESQNLGQDDNEAEAVDPGAQLAPPPHSISAAQMPTVYTDLSPESMRLDMALFLTVSTIVKGRFFDVISGLRGRNARYSFAIAALWKHAALNDSTRRLAAMDNMQGLSYHGDPLKWKLDFMKNVREVYESKMTLEHWMMHCAFKSFEGKNSQVQAMIAKDINEDGFITDSMNFDEVATNYTRFLSTMATGKNGNRINLAEKKAAAERKKTTGVNGDDKKPSGKVCNRCGEAGHHPNQCKHKTSVCKHCGLVGHLAKVCHRKKMSKEAARKEIADRKSTPKDTAVNTATPPPSYSSQFTDAALLDLQKKLKSGEIKLQCTVSKGHAPQAPGNYPEPLILRRCRATPEPHSSAYHDDSDSTWLKSMLSLIAPAACHTGGPLWIKTQGCPKIDASTTRSSGPTTSQHLAKAWEPSIECSTTSRLSGPVSSSQHLGKAWEPSIECPTTSSGPSTSTQHTVEAWEPLYRCSSTSTMLASENGTGTSLGLAVGTHCEAPCHRDVAQYGLNNPSQWAWPTRSINMAKPSPQRSEHPPGQPKIVISLCDGLGGMALTLKRAKPDLKLAQYIAVEKSATSRKVAQATNPVTANFPGITHGLNGKHDIFDITEEDIAALPKNSILLDSHSPECKDHSKMRLLPDRNDYKGPPQVKGVDPRKGLEGKYGRTVKQCLLIRSWIAKYHPDAKFFFEEVVFDDMPEDWKVVCDQLGTPTIIDAHDYSYTRRQRAYWFNFELPDGFDQFLGHRDPNTVMDPGRKVQKQPSRKGLYCKPVGGSWKDTDQGPEANTNAPIVVFDEAHDWKRLKGLWVWTRVPLLVKASLMWNAYAALAMDGISISRLSSWNTFQMSLRWRPELPPSSLHSNAPLLQSKQNSAR